MVGDRYKLGVWTDPGSAHRAWDWRGKARDQLDHRRADPQEIENLIGRSEVAPVEKELRGALAEGKRTLAP